MEKWHKAAEQKGVKIVHCSGYDRCVYAVLCMVQWCDDADFVIMCKGLDS